MSTHDLHDLYIEQVKDLYAACTQSHAMTRRLVEAATDDPLTDALCAGVEGIERGRDTMDQLLTAAGHRSSDATSRGMEGLTAEADAEIFGRDYDNDFTRDAAIIAHYQRMAHYAIAGYGTIRSFADRLEMSAERDAVQECLDKSYDGDRRFTEIATRDINAKAA